MGEAVTSVEQKTRGVIELTKVLMKETVEKWGTCKNEGRNVIKKSDWEIELGNK